MPQSSKPFATYEKVPLRSDEITVAVVQSKLNIEDPARGEKQVKENLDRMLWLFDQAQYWDLRKDIKKDFVIFHEFPLQGFKLTGTREEELRHAVEVPGEETEAIGKKAKQYNCYVAFGCYARLKDWPGHFIDMGIIIDPRGEIILKQWKMRQLSGLAFSTTVYDVLPAFVERYGWDAVFPVARTDIGNLALTPCVYEPEIMRALALKGAELWIRIMTIGAGFWHGTPLPALRGAGPHNLRMDFQVGCAVNNVYGVFVNNAVTPDHAIGDWAAGASAVFDCDGRIIAEVMSSNETMCITSIPMAAYRKYHQLPNFHKELFTDLYENHSPRYPAGALLDYLPRDPADAVAYFKKLARW